MVAVLLIYQGPESDFQQFSSRFQSFGPLSESTKTTTFDKIADAAGFSDGDRVCMPVGLDKYNITAQRAVYERFNEMIRSYPGLNASAMLFEGYANEAVKQIPEDSTAVGDRQANLLA